MKNIALIVIAAFTLGACASYQPSEANCFSFMAVAPTDSDPCDFVPLEGATIYE
jgi:uncharacterized lipoprotein YmbA